MAERKVSLKLKVAASLPFVLPVLGGTIGIFYVTVFAREANPLIWIVLGAIAGRLLAHFVLKALEAQELDITFGPRGQDEKD